MPTASALSRDPTLETQVFWIKHRREIVAAIAIALLAGIAFGGYRFYATQRASAAAAVLSAATGDPDYQTLIARYPGTPASASAYLLLAESQRNEKKFAEANVTLQAFIDNNADHELIPAAKVAMAGNFESMGKIDEALAQYQQVAANYPKSFAAPLALISEVSLLKTKNRIEEARQICERVMTDYRNSLWMEEASRQLHFLKPAVTEQVAPRSTVPPLLAAPAPTVAPKPNSMPAGPPQPSARPNNPR